MLVCGACVLPATNFVLLGDFGLCNQPFTQPTTTTTTLNLGSVYLLAHDAADEAYAFLNESMGLVARTGEADAQNLVAAFGVVMSLVAFPCARAEEHPYANDPVDSAAERFMAGRLLVADYVLARLDAPWLHYLYCHVGPVRRAERAALLSLLIAKVRAEKAVVETFGGMNFFKQEMTSPDGTLALYGRDVMRCDRWCVM